MAPPATKRRKLEHSDSEAESEGSFADFGEADTGAALDASDAEDAAAQSGDDMDGVEAAEDGEDDESMSEDEENDFEEEADVHPSRKQTTAGKATSAAKPPKRPVPSLQDGVYTAESFKSNMFKLQLDELLDQVKLKYGKREAPAENAMRTLKTIIEQIPSRDPLPVRYRRIEWKKHKLTIRRSLTPRKPSSQPVSQFPSPLLARRKTPCISCSMNDLRASMRPAVTRSRLRLDTKTSSPSIW